MAASAGFLFASRGHVNLVIFVAMLIGLSLVIASACVFNNFIDRDIDSKMSRTKHRALVNGSISPRAALVYGALLGLIGVFMLAAFTNALTLTAAVFGFFAYVVLYGLAKRRTTHGTVVGSISGAVPPVVGYVAVTGRLDLAAIILFLILVLWQMPHFYAIAIYRLSDYAAAKIPVLPISRGVRSTKIQMVVYILAYSIAVAALGLTGNAGTSYVVVSVALGLGWLALGLRGFTASNDTLWARQMFRFSLLVITGLCVMLSLNAILP